MNRRSFFLQLGGFSFGIALLLFLLNLIPLLHADQWLSWISWLFFILFTVIVYFAASKAALSDDLYAFTRLIIAVVMGKMFFSVLIVLLYVKLTNPESRFFLISFFVVYLAFTIFELHFMTKLGKKSGHDKR